MPKKKSIRTTIALEEGQHKHVVKIAEESDASVAWVIRQAVTWFLAERPEKRLVIAGRKKKD